MINLLTVRQLINPCLLKLLAPMNDQSGLSVGRDLHLGKVLLTHEISTPALVVEVHPQIG
jgi:hypothetical protein